MTKKYTILLSAKVKEKIKVYSFSYNLLRHWRIHFTNSSQIHFILRAAGGGRDMFASVGADGSVRMFDLRHLEHSTIIYEDPQHTPLLR